MEEEVFSREDFEAFALGPSQAMSALVGMVINFQLNDGRMSNAEAVSVLRRYATYIDDRVWALPFLCWADYLENGPGPHLRVIEGGGERREKEGVETPPSPSG